MKRKSKTNCQEAVSSHGKDRQEKDGQAGGKQTERVYIAFAPSKVEVFRWSNRHWSPMADNQAQEWGMPVLYSLDTPVFDNDLRLFK